MPRMVYFIEVLIGIIFAESLDDITIALFAFTLVLVDVLLDILDELRKGR